MPRYTCRWPKKRGTTLNTNKFVFLLIAATSSACFNAHAQKWNNGITNDKSAAYVATVNESDTILGKYCYFDTNTCMWVLMSSVSCKDKDSYPALLSADKEAQSIELVCLGAFSSTRYRYGIKPYDSVNPAIVSSKKIGIASALSSGEFRVNRFDISGITESHDAMIEFFSKRRNTKPADQTL